MIFTYEPTLLEYMNKKGKHIIIVEEVTANNSDFEITELHVYLIHEKRAEEFKTKKRYRSIDTDAGIVLLPPLKLEFDDVVTFGLKSFLGFKYVTYKGIKI